MSEPSGARTPAQVPEGLDPLAVRDVTAWIQQWSRTLKTWRLYGEHNPTLEKFRAELASGLEALLETRGAITLRFTTDTILWREANVHQARSREDNLSRVFFRDGIQSITFVPGIDRAELDLFLASTIRASDRANQGGDEDLVTLLWDAELGHLDMNYVSAEASLELEDEGGHGAGTEAQGGRPPLAWPGSSGAAGDEPAAPSRAPVAGAAGGTPESAPTRSEDWPSRDPGGALVEQFNELDALAGSEVARFQRERERENAIERGVATLALVADACDCGLEPGERAELEPLLERLFLDALVRGAWNEARRAVTLWLEGGAAGDDSCAWLGALARADSVVTAGVVQALDRQGQADVAAFLELVAALGRRGLDWYLPILAESQQQRVRRPLARAIAGVAADDIPRLARWLEDPRWYVVRNVVHILHWIGGDATLAPLSTAMRHPDRRVRLEVLAVLARATPEAARPLLLRLLDSDDPRVLSGALHRLSASRDPEVARRILELVQLPGFAERAAEEQRALLSALGATGDDTLLPSLAELLDPARKPSPAHTAFLQGVALCAARIATPAAAELLQRAQASRWQATREAATLALAARGVR
jgi:HEAT repeat protein